jgi:putative tributyrin esterase
MILTQINLFSDVLATRCTLNVLLPQRELREPSRRCDLPFRVLYLLHGYSDDYTAWQRWTSIERYIEDLNMVAVMPAVQNSAYTDMLHGGKFFTYLTEELPALLHATLPLSPRRSDTFVAGLSMGGYGAFKLALSRPDLYAAAGSLSGALDLAEVINTHGDHSDLVWLNNMQNIFGDLEKVPGGMHDLFALAKQASGSSVKPRLFQYCGTEDFLYTDNLRFRDFIRPLGFDYHYEETPGDHTWNYWDIEIQKFLTWLDLK